MVVESLINPISAKKKPWKLFFLGFAYASIACFLAYWIFRGDCSLVMVFFTVLACAPLMYQALKEEELVDLNVDSEKSMLISHAKSLNFMIFLFFGITFAYTFWNMVLPDTWTVQLFSVQHETLTQINSKVTGDMTENIVYFSRIFFNNMKVMIFCIMFSLIFGLGAIFILVWNASVLGVALSDFISSKLSMYSGAVGLEKVSGYFHVVTWGIFRYSIHGVFEIMAYFVAGLAGGIISVAISRHDFGTKKIEKVLLDSSNLILIAIGLLVFAGLIEAFITPMFF